MLLFSQQLARGRGRLPSVVSALCKPRASWAPRPVVVRTPSLTSSGWELAPAQFGAGPPQIEKIGETAVSRGLRTAPLGTLCSTWGRPPRWTSIPAGSDGRGPRLGAPHSWGPADVTSPNGPTAQRGVKFARPPLAILGWLRHCV